MWVIGSWTNSMAKGLKLGEMEPSTKEIMQTEKSQAKDSSPGLTVQSLKVIFSIMTFMGSEYTLGMMVDYTLDPGSAIKCMVGVFSHGLMGANMRESIKMIKNQVSAYFTGQMEEDMRELGKMASSMGKPTIGVLLESSRKDIGRMEGDKDGQMNETLYKLKVT